MATTPTITTKGFIKDFAGNNLLPITRGELVLDAAGNIALASDLFLAGTLKDSAGNPLPGLITAAERAMLNGTGSNGESLSDLYAKIEKINTGLTIGDKTYSFYDSTGEGTPITIVGTENQITIATNENTNDVQLTLAQINTSATAIASGVVKGIVVDEYGRVTSVTASDLTNDDIPEELSGKTLSGCITKAVKADEKFAIVNKDYVDTKFQEANAVATGALKFGGVITSLSDATTATDGNYTYHYYKVTAQQSFELPADITADNITITVKAGDTLIVDEKDKLVHVPSGDDITTLTITKTFTDGKSEDIINNQLGNVTLEFSPIFSIEKLEGNDKFATISIPPASAKIDGYLSAIDYARFDSYATNFATEFVSSVDSNTAGVYTIGTLKVGTSQYPIKGINDTYELNFIDTVVVEEKTTKIDPTIQFSKNGTVDSSISYKGTNGVIVTKDGNTLNISQQENVSTNSTYLSIGEGADNNKFTINIGHVDKDSGTIVDGLTSYSQLVALAERIAQQIETIDYSLEPKAGDPETEYRYGNAKLVAAITLDTI